MALVPPSGGLGLLWSPGCGQPWRAPSTSQSSRGPSATRPWPPLWFSPHLVSSLAGYEELTPREPQARERVHRWPRQTLRPPGPQLWAMVP